MTTADLPFYDAGAVAHALRYPALIAALQAGFREGCDSPPRTVHALPGDRTRILVMMPVSQDDLIAVKIATVLPDNPVLHDVPAIHALVLLVDGKTGAPRALLDGTEITRRRTAAASALAAQYLARPDATKLLMIGTGALAPHLIAAHASVRPIEAVTIHGRSFAKAESVADACRAQHANIRITAVDDVAASAASADVICCATSARSPVLRGRWMRAGTHVDLVGSFSPDSRETDDDVLRNARIVVDTHEGALSEAGDLLIPLASGAITREQIVTDLTGLCSGQVTGRENATQTTVFKSVGTALEDLVAARLVLADQSASTPAPADFHAT